MSFASIKVHSEVGDNREFRSIISPSRQRKAREFPDIPDQPTTCPLSLIPSARLLSSPSSLPMASTSPSNQKAAALCVEELCVPSCDQPTASPDALMATAVLE